MKTPKPTTIGVEELLKSRRAVIAGHFLLSSGLHSDHYVQCARLFEDPGDAARLGKDLAVLAPRGTQTIVSPALGGVLIGYEVARALGIRFLFAERENGKMILRRGFHLAPMEKVVVVEDVFTTGGSTLEVMEAVREQEAQTIGVLSVVNRGCDPERFGVPAYSLADLEFKTWRPEECPLCAAQMPVVKPGSRSTGNSRS